MSDRAFLALYLLGVAVTATVVFWQTLGRKETGDVFASTFFAGLLWPPFVALFVLHLLGEGLDRLNSRRRATLETRAAALEEVERIIADGAA